MKLAGTAAALVLTLLAWVAAADAGVVPSRTEWDEDTPAPNGQLTCSLTIDVSKPQGLPGELLVRLVAHDGEAEIPELVISSGKQPGCPIFFDSSNKAKVPLDVGPDSFVFNYTLHLHAHDTDCTTAGVSEGLIRLALSVPRSEERRVGKECRL